MEIFDKIKALANKQGKYTAKEREFIADLCVENDIQLNTLCPDCYKDAVVQLYSIYKPQEGEQSAGGYVLRAGVNVMLHARNGNVYHVCEATLTEENARKWLAAGLDVKLFAQVPDEHNGQD